ncbi:Mov34/MPN/PAD-1 family protein [Pseudomonas brassicacearum]|uniref:Mov34/MPN/PAD-1 family protein n=1 Tax=Pseudomonas brassicacearum TaxID=930166 RepID=UPI0009B85712
MRNEIIFSWPDGSGRYVLIEGHVWDFLFSHAQTKPSTTEAGGILLGNRAGGHIHVISATGPLSNDKRARLSFDRLDTGHQKAAHHAWASSGGTVDYVGDWHTHPQSIPTPSSKDYVEWKKLTKALPSSHLFAIVGSSGNNFWLGCGANLQKILPLTRG